ncbi:peptidase G2 autoproteolytic cleavage domain-containing protein [Lysinibacillus fusiformis]|uniref:peptidase G2 autoproteolytic cleavage domain-containing protein n=1 Tax=Lysinibacillus fusiformis TaxID=28031 RepID=UPI00055CDF05
MASSIAAHAEGDSTRSERRASHAEGELTRAAGRASHAEGSVTTASGDASHAEGARSIAGVVGDLTKGFAAHAEGEETRAEGRASHSEGGPTRNTAGEIVRRTTASNDFSHAEGQGTTASGRAAHAEGSDTIARGLNSHAEGSATLASASNAHAEGSDTIARGLNSHAEGAATVASGSNSHAEGSATVASGVISHAEGSATIASGLISHAEGSATIASGLISHAEGDRTRASGRASHAEGVQTIADGSFSHAEGNNTSTNGLMGAHIMGRFGDANELAYSWYLANGTSLTNKGLAAKILSNGNVKIDGTVSMPASDYAELFETVDSNAIDVGYFVTFDEESDKIRKAHNKDDYILGITSSTPAILGNSGELRWKNKYALDEWGRVKYKDVIVPAKKDEKGNILTPEHTTSHPLVNPEWDSTKEYIPRLIRPEWAAVGLLGQLLVRDDGTCKPGKYCMPNHEGIATASNEGYRVMKRTGPNQILVMFK